METQGLSEFHGMGFVVITKTEASVKVFSDEGLSFSIFDVLQNGIINTLLGIFPVFGHFLLLIKFKTNR